MKKLILILLLGFSSLLTSGQVSSDTLQLQPPTQLVKADSTITPQSETKTPKVKKQKPPKTPQNKGKFMKRGDFWSNVLDLAKILVPAILAGFATTK